MVGIFVEPVVSELTRVRYTKHSIKVHLRVVDEEGELFTESGLSQMCLEKNEVPHIERLCRRRVLALSKKYLPRGTTDTAFLSDECGVDSRGRVHITFYLCGDTRNVVHA